MNRFPYQLFLTLILTMMFTSSAEATQLCKVVRANYSSGSQTGADWANAYNGLPTTLTRGTVYYLADGVYNGYAFNSASGSGSVEIRKAQTYDHCTDTGWDAGTMGSGQATFKGPDAFSLNIENVIVNGNGTSTGAGCGGAPGATVTAHPSNPSDCGIAVDNNYCASSVNDACPVIETYSTSTNFTFRYMEWIGKGDNASEQYYFFSHGSTSNTAVKSFDHIYGHNFGCNVLVNVGKRTVDHSYFWGTETDLAVFGNHGQYSYDNDTGNNGIERNSVYRDIVGTSVWGFEDGSNNSGWAFYNNVIWYSSPLASWVSGGNVHGITTGIVGCMNSGTVCNNFLYYNNTIVNPQGNNLGAFINGGGSTGTGWVVRNNLYYGGNVGLLFSGTQDHNSFLAMNGNCASGTANVCADSSGNPFVNWQAGNFTLVSDNANWDNRLSLGAPYDTDADGNPFTSSRGAYQFSSTTAKVNPPSGLAAVAN